MTELIERLEVRRLQMNFDADVRIQLESKLSEYPQLQPARQAHYLVLLQDAQLRSGEIKKSLHTREKLKPLEQLFPSKHLSLYSLMLEGIARAYLNQTSEAQKIYENLAVKAKKEGDYLLYFHSRLSLGDLLTGLRDFSQALLQYSEAQKVLTETLLPTLEEKERYSKEGEMNYRIGYVYGRMLRHEEAIDFIGEALRLDTLAGNQRNVRFDLFRLAEENRQLGKTDEAKAYYNKLLLAALAGPHPDVYRVFAAKVGLARLYIEEDDSQQAALSLDEASDHMKEVENRPLLMRYHLARAQLALLQGRHDDAVKAASLFIDIAGTEQWDDLGIAVYEVLGAAYEALGQYTESLSSFQKMHELYRKRSDYARLMAAEVERTRFDFERRELELKSLSRDKRIAELKLQSAEVSAELGRERLVTAVLLIASLLLLILILVSGRRRFKRLAEYDALTGVKNRRAILGYGEKVFRSRESLATLLVDIDFFKRINDNFGHACGDEILCAVAKIARGLCEQNVEFGRVGGEEFLFILPRKDSNEIGTFSEMFMDKIRQLKLPDGSSLSCSIGISQSNGELSDFMGLIEKADIALYSAKRSGRDRVVYYSSDLEA
ncbi:GGDEF domain-containing protein [uncultured Pseudoteredinibacter sp.]|uniref:GGDEF domain-containing protein n=1 Tax=uncultured Pseudoteredinibacter sp. TaxID=1641701 RepID=UPI002638F5F4|nr:GGDEF domain-containing protein [uncultured Pseudoteredinibacter sp.]